MDEWFFIPELAKGNITHGLASIYTSFRSKCFQFIKTNENLSSSENKFHLNQEMVMCYTGVRNIQV